MWGMWGAPLSCTRGCPQLCSTGTQWALCREPLGLGRDGASEGAAPDSPSLLSILLPE